ncbi:MAG: prenyltransferase/squalene oxidase repeat-containing protein [Saprospiraceae bacterium]
MKNWRSIPLVLICAMLLQCAPEYPEAKVQAALQKTCAYLWSKQSPDGGWHSETTGLMKGGESVTAFVLHTLLQVPDSIFTAPPEGKEKALTFLRNHINEAGMLGLSDPGIIDYPNYSTAYALRIFAVHGAPEDSLLVRKMTVYLLGQQFTEQRGIDTTHTGYGAWGFGELKLPPGETAHVDLSHTRRAMEALRAALPGESHPAFQHATRFLKTLQLPEDGGFISSSVTLGTNKGRWDGANFHSYATATCDGLLALLAAGYSRNDAPVQAAFNWLKRYPELDSPAGMPLDDPNQWHRAMFFYHLGMRAEAFAAMEYSGNWRAKMAHILLPKQLPDGSFVNPAGAINKENDPLIASSLCLIALSAIDRH